MSSDRSTELNGSAVHHCEYSKSELRRFGLHALTMAQEDDQEGNVDEQVAGLIARAQQDLMSVLVEARGMSAERANEVSADAMWAAREARPFQVRVRA